jgi:hypothetical protein
VTHLLTYDYLFNYNLETAHIHAYTTDASKPELMVFSCSTPKKINGPDFFLILHLSTTVESWEHHKRAQIKDLI